MRHRIDADGAIVGRTRGRRCRDSRRTDRDLGFARRHRGGGGREGLHVLLAARRPAALLDAERRDRQAAGFRRQHEADAQHAILLAALHDVAGLDEHFVGAEVLDLQLADGAGLVHLDGTLAQRLVEGQRHGARGGFAVDQVDRKVLVNDRAADAVLVGARRIVAKDHQRQRRTRQRKQCSAMHGISPKDESTPGNQSDLPLRQALGMEPADFRPNRGAARRRAPSIQADASKL